MMRYFFTFYQSNMLKEIYIYIDSQVVHNVQSHHKILNTQIKETNILFWVWQLDRIWHDIVLEEHAMQILSLQ